MTPTSIAIIGWPKNKIILLMNGLFIVIDGCSTIDLVVISKIGIIIGNRFIGLGISLFSFFKPISFSFS